MRQKSILISLTLVAFASVSFGETAEDAWYGIALRKKADDKNKAFLYVENNPSLPNILIYGDSISIAYTPVVREALAGKANVYRLHVNGGDSSSFISKMETLHSTMQNSELEGHWTHEWDVIQINVGLHDLKYVAEHSKLDKVNGEQVSTLGEYERNLRKIFSYLNKHHPKAKRVFALTTPVPEGESGRHAGDAAKFNKVAMKVLKDHPEIVVNDLYSFTKPNHANWWTKPGNVHFNPEGVQAQGEEVARVLEALLDQHSLSGKGKVASTVNDLQEPRMVGAIPYRLDRGVPSVANVTEDLPKALLRVMRLSCVTAFWRRSTPIRRLIKSIVVEIEQNCVNQSMIFPRVALSLLSLSFLSCAFAVEKPNILWIFAEDTSPWMGCYGDEVNEGHTPHIDSLASQGIRFSRAYAPAPVCSACRSAVMAGQNQIRFGAHEHRSSRGPRKIPFPSHLKLLPQILKEGGYYTFNLGKDDYNFVWDQKASYSLQQKTREPVPWESLKANQPFYGQIQTAGGKNNVSKFPANRKTDPASVTVPPDYPQNQLYREVVAEHYDSIRKDDDFIGDILAGLKANGLWDNTIVVYVSDHGANQLVRHKQMPTEGGLHVPLIVRGPKGFVPETQVRDDLVDIMDLSATTLAWAGMERPDWYEGQDLFSDEFIPRTYVAAAKDRLDHTFDRVRTLRTERFRYTRNYKLDRVLLQPQYRDQQPYTQNLHELYNTGKLAPKLAEIYFGERRPEEFYDISQDPHQLNNLANDPQYADELDRHRDLLDAWLEKGDLGAFEEPDEEIAFQDEGPAKWRKVNPEYEHLRKDSDGDGLSDEWEGYNDRDPKDGKLLFTFDCGGWQTEGWLPNPGVSNIAGFKGYLDFDLPRGQGSLVRSGLNADLTKQGGSFSVVMGVSKPTLVWLSLNHGDGVMRKVAGPVTVLPGRSYTDARFRIPESGMVKALRIDFQSEEGGIVEIESMRAN